ASPSGPLGSASNSGFKQADPVDWEARYRVGDTPWDEGFAAPALTEVLGRNPIHGVVLVPGSGPGPAVRALAAQANSVTGLDLSSTAIALAQSFPPEGNERYEQGDLFDLPASWSGRFDWVAEHTCFCAIPPSSRGDYVRAITAVLKPGGHYFAIFYLNPAAIEGPPHGTSREEIKQLFEADFELQEEWLPSEAFEGRERREICQLWRKGYETISLLDC
ncbi:MAG: methyltransferase domain-containing protein, partial [Verrucomicrobia bacterium]|nr:methyltransferase domain-containing protein [Verrucomicrobiota bacterium]